MLLKKRFIIAGLSTLFSLQAFAASIQLQAEIVPQVLNGKAVQESDFIQPQQLELKEGTNQLVVTIGQLVFQDGKRRKFDSQPMILEFSTGNDELLTLNYPNLRTIEDAKSFEKKPTFSFANQNKQKKEYSLLVMNKNGLQGFRDYEQEVADFNDKNKESTVVTDSEKSAGVGTVNLKTEFSNLSKEQQQEFMQWALRNLK
ncbi:YccT family protein [Vibrio aestuarianus]|uniref:YccT family protein n=1 Tax=Vibrio aestuarianus TaxID=28171 RepID=UPI00237C683C|nr:DUF2057 family protein [Vibrio aestuarianus]MDE1328011.1 DUF2057 domain-containing protein [Vibrio aestuarianus]